MPKLLSELLSMANFILFFSWPPTFDAENRRPNAKRIAPTMCMEI